MANQHVAPPRPAPSYSAPAPAEGSLGFGGIWSGLFSRPKETLDAFGDNLGMFSFVLLNIIFAILLVFIFNTIGLVIGNNLTSKSIVDLVKFVLIGGIAALAFIFVLTGAMFLVLSIFKKNISFGRLFNVVSVLSMAMMLSAASRIFDLLPLLSIDLATIAALCTAIVSSIGAVLASVIIISYIADYLEISYVKITLTYVIVALVLLAIVGALISKFPQYFTMSFGYVGFPRFEFIFRLW